MLRASGSIGELRVGYQRAASLCAWSMALEARLPRCYTFRAAVAEEHPYWITQQPLDLALAVGASEWLWRGVKLEREGGDVVIALAERPIISRRAVPASQGS